MIPFFDMRAEVARVRADIESAIARVLDSGVFVGGAEVEGFERELAAVVGTSFVVGVSSGTDALLATFMALGVEPGDEVVTTPFTFFATAGAAARLGARVVFADIDATTLTLDPQAALSRVSVRTRAIVPVHLYGHPSAMPDAPCAIVEDAAQSVGGSQLRGIAAAVSFFPTKNLGALGDAGAVLSNDVGLAARLRLLRTQGAQPKYHHVAVGGNFRLDALQAAILRAKLPHLVEWTANRRAHAMAYRDAFAAAHVPSELHLPAAHPLHVYHQFVIRAPRRDALREYLAAREISTEVYYPSALHMQPAFAKLGHGRGAFPVAERAADEVLALPIYPALPQGVPARIVDAIAAFYR